MTENHKMNKELQTWKEFIKQLLYYHTNKVVQIRSWKLGVVYYLTLLLVIFYVVFWSIYWNKGYQAFYPLVGNTAVKVKGASYFMNSSAPEDQQIFIWDSVDVVYPPKEPDALFMTTNFQLIPMQTRGICNSTVPCSSNSNCPTLQSSADDNGIYDGICDPYSSNCSIYAWCPPEASDEIPTNYLNGVQNFTVFIRVTIKFPALGVTLTNAKQSLIPGVNLFSISQMLSDSTSFESVQQLGGAFAVIITWNCNLDNSADDCLLEPSDITFTRIDQNDNTGLLSSGYNFRYADYYYLPSKEGSANFTEYRDLFKVYGLRFIFLLNGQAGKFNIIPLIINIGAGLALLSIATLISDFITLYFLPGKLFYRKVKYELIEEQSKDEQHKLVLGYRQQMKSPSELEEESDFDQSSEEKQQKPWQKNEEQEMHGRNDEKSPLILESTVLL